MAEPTTAPAGTDDAVRDEEVVRLTSELIRIDTTNRGGGDCRERPAAEYVAERLAEAGLAPALLESQPGRANVVARVPGTDPGRPALLLHGHLDVVPADPAEWSVDPFAGEVRDGVVWGRGAIDMKNMDAMMLAVVRAWARRGVRPARDIVLAFTADEEDSAAAGSDWLVDRHADLFDGCTEGISESGGYTFHAGPGPDGAPLRIYPVAAGERGTAWLELTARGRAGHGSKANPDNAVSHLAAAVVRIAEHRWPVRLTPVVKAAIAGIAAAVGVDADPDAPGFADDVDAIVAKLGPAGQLVSSTLRNSTNPTMLSAGYKVNVIPGTATARIDGRVLPGAVDEFRETLDRLTGPDVAWDFVHREVPLQAPMDTPVFRGMCDALRAHDPGAAVVPFSMSGGTDAKQFSRLGITGYGFTPLRLPEGYDYNAMFHGVDERVPVAALEFGARVLDDFLSTVR